MSTSIYMSQISSILPLMEGDHNQDQLSHFQAFNLSKDHPILFPFVFNNNNTNNIIPSDHQHPNPIFGSDYQPLSHHEVIGGSIASIGGGEMIEQSSSYDRYDIKKPTKMKIMRKAGDAGVAGTAKKPRRRAQGHEDPSQGNMSQCQQQQTPMGVIRVCSDCNTTKTPLWRSGPRGPKSLCNACGIRQRKARRAMMAAPAAAPGNVTAVQAKARKEKRADAVVDRSLPFKKRCKVVVQDHVAAPASTAAMDTKVSDVAAVDAPSGELLDNSIPANWSSKGPAAATAAACFRAPFAQDEITDAAILLMTLSCGLVHT